MSLQVTWLQKVLDTLGALEWSSCVSPLMRLQSLWLWEALITLYAHEWLLSCVSSLMSLQVTEWSFLTAVSSQVLSTNSCRSRSFVVSRSSDKHPRSILVNITLWLTIFSLWFLSIIIVQMLEVALICQAFQKVWTSSLLSTYLQALQQVMWIWEALVTF